MRIFLIRHGETSLNAKGVVQPPDTPLSNVGLAQADLVGERLRDEGIRRLLSSDFLRTRMTAERVAAILDTPITYDPILHERNFGDLRGRSYDDFDFDPFAPDYVPPNGESWRAFHRRIARAWDRILEETTGTDGNLGVVCHGLVCYSICSRLVSVDEQAVGKVPLRFANGSLSAVEAEAPWRVTLLNCHEHLKGMDHAALRMGLV